MTGDPDAPAAEVLAGGAGQLGERDRDPFGQNQHGVGGQRRLRMLGQVAVPFWSSFLADARTYHTAGIRQDRHLKFYGDWDNLQPAGCRMERSQFLRTFGAPSSSTAIPFHIPIPIEDRAAA
ncbi:MAG TPA: hypothetical protein VGC06_00745 [Actinomycetes bacterium]